MWRWARAWDTDWSSTADAMRTLAIAALALALALAGCAADAADPTDADCAPSAPVATVIDDALTVRGAAELVLGSQGGWMITPVLAVDRTMMASDGACVRVALEVDLGAGGGEPITYEVTLPELAGTDAHFYSEPLPVFLSYDLAELDGRTAIITALLADDDVASSCQVVAQLVNRE